MCRLIPIGLFLVVANTAFAQVSISSFTRTVEQSTATFSVEVCGQGTLKLFRNLESTPDGETTADETAAVDVVCGEDDPATVTFVWSDLPSGTVKSWVRMEDGVDNAVFATEGPLETCTGTDLVVDEFSVTSEGATVTFNALVCNNGANTADKFRIGFWPNRTSAPAAGDMGRLFVPVAALEADTCKNYQMTTDQQPNGDFQAWVAVDSGSFISECNEDNNNKGPLSYSLRNPDILIERFAVTVEDTTARYEVTVCNDGQADVGTFFVDIYHDRGDRMPSSSEPGDEAKRVDGLEQKACTTLQFERVGLKEKEYTSYSVVDADQFVSEPQEGNNFSLPLVFKIGDTESFPESGSGCVDNDGDGVGTGPSCTGVPDCDDANAMLSPKMTEVCGDNVDQDCDLTPDDGCEGVDCVDGDGDGFGVGKDCVLEDYDDTDPDIYPWASRDADAARALCFDKDNDGWGVGPGCDSVPDCDDNDSARHPGTKLERCGDGVDNDCDMTVDDGCDGVDCVDNDGDGWGVGTQCVLVDPNDSNPDIFPYSRCVDNDGDGSGVGPDCTGVPDCNDRDPLVGGKAPEICGDGIDNDCDMTVDDGCAGVDCKDGDGDGIGIGGECVVADCDDSDATVAPWGNERCGDNKDDNCNGIADDGCAGRQCVDRDGDGFGSGAACPGPHDCDDEDFAVNPSATESCGDGLDQDCDGTADDGCDTAIDRDGDGYGVGGGVVGVPDCDDQDPTRSPGKLEVCGDGIDNDCDGTVDDGCPGVDCVDNDGDSWGEGADCVIADCDNDDSQRHPWAPEVCDEVDNDCDGTVDEGCPGIDCVDADLDGWGVGVGCAREDCNDEDGGISPWRLERCADGKDNDCDNGVDEDCLVCDDQDRDGYGVGPKCTNWDCNDQDSVSFPGAEETCDLRDNNCDGVVPADEIECALGSGGCSCRTSTEGDMTSGLWVALLLGFIALTRRRRRNSRRGCR